MKRTNLLLTLLALSFAPCFARDIRVGKDAPTIAAAIKAAQPGDTIHLEPRVYRDYAGFSAKQGAPGQPITLDGHGAILDGSDSLDSTQWREVSPGLFAADNLLPRLDGAMIARWFFIFDGRVQHMGRTSKGRSAPLKQPEELKPGEWTFVSDPARKPPPPDQAYTQIHGTFFIRLAPGQSLAGAKIGVPVRNSGVQLSGDNAHVVIRNVTVTHVHNDGFNIHGDCRDVVFENIRAIECGDDGISAHESAQYRVDGLVSIGNSTGITDIGTSQTSYRNVFIARCVGYDLYFYDEGRYRLTNVLVLSSAQNPLTVNGRATGESRVTLENVLIRRLVEPRVGEVTQHAVLDATRCTFENVSLNITGTATWKDCLVDGKPMPQGSPAPGADATALLRLIPTDFQP